MSSEGTAVGTPEDQQRYYATLVEASPTAIVACDPSFLVTEWNPAAERLFGWTRDEAIGTHIDDLVSRHEAIRAEAMAVTSGR